MSNRTTQNRVSLYLGIFLAFIMAASLALPLISNQQLQQQSQVQPTATMLPTVPPPIEDLSTITFDETYLHPSGLFTVAVPSGWEPVTEVNTTGEAQVTMRNPEALSIVEARIIRPTSAVDLSSAEGLQAVFNETWLGSSWREYSTWDETARRVEDDQLVIDFNLTRTGQDYIARQIAYTDGTWIYLVRAVTPSNSSRVLLHLLENERESLEVVDRFLGAPIEWKAVFDNDSKVVIRYPGTWQVTDSAPDAPVSVEGSGAQLRLETVDATVDSAETAAAYVEGLRPGVTVLSTTEIENYGTPGYRVAYTLATPDGTTQSGLVTLLTTDEAVYSANVLLTDVSDTDLNAVDPAAAETDAVISQAIRMTETFSLLPELQVSAAQ